MAFCYGMNTPQSSKSGEISREKVDLIRYVTDITKAFKAGCRPGRRRKTTITLWDDGNAIVQCDVEDKLTIQAQFV